MLFQNNVFGVIIVPIKKVQPMVTKGLLNEDVTGKEVFASIVRGGDKGYTTNYLFPLYGEAAEKFKLTPGQTGIFTGRGAQEAYLDKDGNVHYLDGSNVIPADATPLLVVLGARWIPDMSGGVDLWTIGTRIADFKGKGESVKQAPSGTDGKRRFSITLGFSKRDGEKNYHNANITHMVFEPSDKQLQAYQPGTPVILGNVSLVFTKSSKEDKTYVNLNTRGGHMDLAGGGARENGSNAGSQATANQAPVAENYAEDLEDEIPF
jgi:hypothetical protein